MSTLEKFKAIKEEIDKQRALARQHIRIAFEEGTKELFDKHPKLQAFGWAQYTPYFNDGDECVFGRGDTYFLLESDPTDNAETIEDRVSEFSEDLYSFERYGGKYSKPKTVESDVIADALQEFMDIFEDEDFKEMFDDHKKVVVTREHVSVQDYSHD